MTLLLLHVPRRLAKALKERAQRSLDRMMVEQEDQALVQMAEGGMSAGGVGLADEEEEKRLFVQDDEGEEAYRMVLRAAEKQVHRRMQQHANGGDRFGNESSNLVTRSKSSGGVAFVDIEAAGEEPRFEESR